MNSNSASPNKRVSHVRNKTFTYGSPDNKSESRRSNQSRNSITADGEERKTV